MTVIADLPSNANLHKWHRKERATWFDPPWYRPWGRTKHTTVMKQHVFKQNLIKICPKIQNPALCPRTLIITLNC